MALFGGPAEQVNFSGTAGWRLWSGRSPPRVSVESLVWRSLTTLGLKKQSNGNMHWTMGVEIKTEFQDPSWSVDIQGCELGPWSILFLSLSVTPKYGCFYSSGPYYPSC